MAIIHRIGTPENDGEARAIKQIAKGLPDDCFVFHNFEVTTGRGPPLRVRRRRPHPARPLPRRGQGLPRRDPRQPDAVDLRERRRLPQPDPAGQQEDQGPGRQAEQYSRRLDEVFVETLILPTEDRARAKLNDDQAGRVVHLRDAVDRLSDPRHLPVSTGNVAALADMVCEALFATRPARKVQRIGLYDVVQKFDQDDRFTVFLARHRFIHTQPLTVLKVYHLDV